MMQQLQLPIEQAANTKRCIQCGERPRLPKCRRCNSCHNQPTPTINIYLQTDQPFVYPTPYTGEDLEYLPRDRHGRIIPDTLFADDAIANIAQFKKW